MERAQCAQELDLHFEAKERVQAIVRALMQVPGGFPRLTALSVTTATSLRKGTSKDGACIHMAVAWLLGQSSGLKFLYLDVGALPCLPSLAHIQHLQLHMCADSLVNLMPALASLVTLQTLCLSSPDNSFPGHLNLQGLSQLQSLNLERLVPGSLTLASSTALHATVYSVADARNSLWERTSAIGVLKSFTLEAPSAVIETEDDIPEWLLGSARLVTLVLSLKQFGENPQFYDAILLKGALARSERLCIDCRCDLYAEVPREHNWKLVNLHCDGELNVEFQSVAHFAMSCTAYSFRCDNLQGVHLFSLARCMLQYGRDFEEEQIGDFPDTKSAFHSPCRDILHLDLHDGCHSLCRCGACHRCCRPDNFQGPRVPCND